MASSADLNPGQVRAIALMCLIGEVVYLGWRFRSEWEIAVPALLLVHLIGLLGFGLYWLVARRWRKRSTSEELFVSSGLLAVLVTGGVTYVWGDWMGAHSALGSLMAGIVVAFNLVLVRLAIWGP